MYLCEECDVITCGDDVEVHLVMLWAAESAHAERKRINVRWNPVKIIRRDSRRSVKRGDGVTRV